MEKDLKEWIDRLSTFHSELDGFNICPFARKAQENDGILIGYIGYESIDYISRFIESSSDYEIILFYNLEKNLTDSDLIDIITSLQKNYPSLIFLKDHPDNPGMINGVETGNKKYPIILAQPKDGLIKARNKLKKSKYYDKWTDEYKNEIWGYGNDEGTES